ncbi:hypothetical protein ACI2J5_00770 [Agrobacterium pusense]|uniref:hypothetical protein n=1 Tax=Agrobacterium pusense TaxID=648995 RepID=UPI00384A8DEA
MKDFLVGFIGMAVVFAVIALVVLSVIASFAYLGFVAGLLSGALWLCVFSGLENWANG